VRICAGGDQLMIVPTVTVFIAAVLHMWFWPVGDS